MEAVTLTVDTVTTTTSADGDSTTTAVTQTVPGCLFEPQQAVERTDPRSPGVTTPAKFYAPLALVLDADDEVRAMGHTWAVIGGSMVWGQNTEIPVRRVD